MHETFHSLTQNPRHSYRTWLKKSFILILQIFGIKHLGSNGDWSRFSKKKNHKNYTVVTHTVMAIIKGLSKSNAKLRCTTKIYVNNVWS